jgi:hypothetical protein
MLLGSSPLQPWLLASTMGFRTYGFPGPVVDFTPWIWWDYPPRTAGTVRLGRPTASTAPAPAPITPRSNTCPEQWVIVPAPD